MPQASVVLPTHNRLRLLDRAVACAVGQEGVDHEVIVVDDGSTDGTAERLAELAAAEPRLRVIRHEVGSGVARARNAGIATAQGEWIAFLDDDDVWGPRKLRAQLDAAAARDASLVYGAYVAVDGELRPIRSAPLPDPDELAHLVLRTNPIGGPSTFMARADLVRDGGFDESLSALADWDILIRLARAGRAAACTEVVVGYVEHGSNMMVTKATEIGDEFERLARKHEAAATEAGVDFGDLWLAGWRGYRLRASGRRLRAAAQYARRGVGVRSPSDFARALGSIFGESGLQRGRRIVGFRTPDPPWLRALREPV